MARTKITKRKPHKLLKRRNKNASKIGNAGRQTLVKNYNILSEKNGKIKSNCVKAYIKDGLLRKAKNPISGLISKFLCMVYIMLDIFFYICCWIYISNTKCIIYIISTNVCIWEYEVFICVVII